MRRHGVRRWARRLSTAGLSALASAAVAGGPPVATQCSGARNPIAVYEESFDAGVIDPAVWNLDANEGSVGVVAAALRVASPSTRSFPFVTSATILLPESGAFSVRWSADYEQASPQSTCSLVASRGVPSDGDSGNADVGAFSACQDNALGFNVAVALSASQMAIAHSVPEIELDAVDLEYCWLEDRVELWVDGTRAFEAVRHPALIRPDSLWFGNPARAAVPAAWSNFALDHMRVSTFDVEAVAFADGFEPSEVP